VLIIEPEDHQSILNNSIQHLVYPILNTQLISERTKEHQLSAHDPIPFTNSTITYETEQDNEIGHLATII